MFHVKHYDVMVVGGGHAGTEAAAAAARLGARVALLTQNAATVGVMSCNPSIGGIGKGHLVREIDALDGLMARAADAAAIHYRMLNRRKGAAVQGPRIQADRRRYRTAIRAQLATMVTLDILEGEAVDIVPGRQRADPISIILGEGTILKAPAVVLATGTFLGGRIFRGSDREAGGRIAERPAAALAKRLRGMGLRMGRMKTGTPPRLDGRTIDWARLDPQPSDAHRWRMSPMTTAPRLPQLACAITRTSAKTHDVIRAGMDQSPLRSGAIEGGGPRYCPSIEDKVERFGDREGHQIFLEPEGLDDHIVYPNGISTSLSTDTQAAMIASIPGLERALITTPGYAVEYDHLDPRSLDHRLALTAIDGIFCAGQINGTTGYEEAGAQGLLAGANAAAHALGREPLVLDRASSYLGVMVDDLVLQGISEPYRMLTARAEYRLSLRADNAEARLSAVGTALGLLSEERRRIVKRRDAIRIALRDGGGVPDAPDDLVTEVAEDRRYAPYLVRQAAEVAAMRGDAAVAIARGDALTTVPGLSSEMVERLRTSDPVTLDQARRVQGVTPAALSALWLHAKARA